MMQSAIAGRCAFKDPFHNCCCSDQIRPRLLSYLSENQSMVGSKGFLHLQLRVVQADVAPDWRLRQLTLP